MTQTQEIVIPKDDFVLIPLGGATGIGMNCFAYGYQGKWLVVDLGIGFPDDNLPGVDALIPSVDFLAEHQEDILALLITHAHEDHIGGVGYMWQQLHCPVYASPFAQEVLNHKLAESNLLGRVEVQTLTPKETLVLGDFEITPVAMAHSIPQALGLVIKTPQGTCVHTGDWKNLQHSELEQTLDLATLRKIGRQGVDVLVCDSTNMSGEKSDKTEDDVRDTLVRLVGQYPQKQVFITCFASNIVRLKSIYAAAQQTNRQVCLIGKSLWRMDAAARATGYFEEMPEFLSQDEALDYPKGTVLFVCTGCQGEPMSGLNTLLRNRGRADVISFDDEDVLIFSSRVIPGNEKQIAYLQKRLKAQGVKIITTEDDLVHVSGHFSGDEVQVLYRALKPKMVLPVHGEPLSLLAHVDKARAFGIPYALSLEDGQIITLGRDEPVILGTVPTAVLAVDGKQILPLNAGVIKKRRQMLEGRTIVLTVVVDALGTLKAPIQVSAFGLMTDEETTGLLEELDTGIANLTADLRADDELFKSALVHIVRQFIVQNYGKKAMVNIHLIRVS